MKMSMPKTSTPKSQDLLSVISHHDQSIHLPGITFDQSANFVSAQLAVRDVGVDGAGGHVAPVGGFSGGDESTLRNRYVGIRFGEVYFSGHVTGSMWACPLGIAQITAPSGTFLRYRLAWRMDLQPETLPDDLCLRSVHWDRRTVRLADFDREVLEFLEG